MAGYFGISLLYFDWEDLGGLTGFYKGKRGRFKFSGPGCDIGKLDWALGCCLWSGLILKEVWVLDQEWVLGCTGLVLGFK